MPLVNLTTDLKSLKYGQDKPGGNSSGQPFITTDIDGAHGTNFTVPGRNLLNLIGLNNITLPAIPNIGASLSRSKIGRIVNDVLSGDELIRGGALGSVQASINDTFRIGSFFLSLPKGPLFIAKQNMNLPLISYQLMEVSIFQMISKIRRILLSDYCSHK